MAFGGPEILLGICTMVLILRLSVSTVSLLTGKKTPAVDLTAEKSREYDFVGRVYKIDSPASLTMREGGTTHQVTDKAGVVHIVPSIGFNGCVVRVTK